MKPHRDLLPFGPLEPENPPKKSPPFPREIDDSWPLEIDDEDLDALIPDDDYEPLPEYGDFWTERDAA